MSTTHHMPSRDASSPWSGGPSPEERNRGRRARRVVEHLVVLVLLSALALVLATTYPLIIGLVVGHRPEPARRGIERLARERGWAVGEPAARAPSRYAPSMPGRRSPHSPGSTLEKLLFGLGDDVEPAPKAPPVGDAAAFHAVPRAVVRMRSSASNTAEPVLVVTPMMRLLVVRDTGEWLLCAVREEDRTVIGWVRRRDVRLEH